MQIANPALTVIIDPVKLPDMQPLLDLLYDPAIIKVLHAARQDLELFYHMQGHVPGPLFDTQLAAPLAGHAEYIGYSNLVALMLDIELHKSQARTNWKKRPLREEQLRYAADDVIYLGELYQSFTRSLSADQLEQLAKGNSCLLETEQYHPNPDKIWRKIRDARRFKGKNLSVLQHLASWRETTARLENRPRKWILPDAALINMARLLPELDSDLVAIKGIDDNMIKRYGQDLLALIATARNELPQPLK